jgi:DNA sulfur modification protein DndC
LPAIEKALRRGFFDDEADATSYALYKRGLLDRSRLDHNTVDPLDIADGYVRLASTEASSDDPR